MRTRYVMPCPTGCGRKVDTGKLLCLPCWREVPKHLQNDVYRTWRKVLAGSTDDDVLQAYETARDAAIGSIR